MIKNYLKIAWRNIIRHKGYAAINIAGLTIGVAACLLIFVVIHFELSFEKDQPNFDNIYHVVTQLDRSDGVSYNPGVPGPAADALRLDFPQAKVAALNSSYGSQITITSNNGNNNYKKFIEDKGVVFIEPQFFGIFSRKWLSGQASVLKDPNMVVIDKSTAIKYFGEWKQAVGKSLKMDNILNLKVAGIVQDGPSNTDLPFKVMVSYITMKNHKAEYQVSDNWGSIGSNLQVFMLFPPGTSLPKISSQLKVASGKHFTSKGPQKNHLLLQPLSAMHFDTRFGGTLGDHVTSYATLKTLGFIAVLIIIMASINFINLTTAQSVGRSKEVGIRKVLGSSRKQLVVQVIGETTMIVLCAVIIAFISAELALPQLVLIASVPDDLGLLNSSSLLFLVITTLLVIVLSGLYPALVVSGFKPVSALKNKISAASAGGIPLRRMLVVAQFGISQLLIIGTVVAVRQMNFVNNADLGFNKDALLIMPGPSDSVNLLKMQAFKAQLLQNPAVQSVSFISDAPSSDNNSATGFNFNNSTKDLGFPVFLKAGDADYFKTFGLKFAAGKGYDLGDTMRQAVINETLMKQLGIQRPDDVIGKTIRLGGGPWVPVTGVVEDFKTNSLRDAVKPVIIFPKKDMEAEVAIKLKTKKPS